MKDRMVNAGPCVVTSYPFNSWSRMNLPEGMRLEEVWKLCGPMVDKNLSSRPLWEVFCMVYLEALQHGSSNIKEIEQ